MRCAGRPGGGLGFLPVPHVRHGFRKSALCLPRDPLLVLPCAACASVPLPTLHNPHMCLVPRMVDVTHLGSPLGTKSLGENGVGEAGDVGVALLDDGDGENRDVGADDAASDGLANSLSGSSGAVARVALGQEEADSVCLQDTLLHGESAVSNDREMSAACAKASRLVAAAAAAA